MRQFGFVVIACGMLIGCSGDSGSSPDGNGGASASASSDGGKHGAASRDEFTARYVTAANRDDRPAMKTLVHPECLTPMNEKTSGFYKQYFDNCLNDNIPEQRKVEFRALSGDATLPGEKMLDYPIRPTHKFRVTYSDEEQSSTTVIRTVVQQDGRWFMIVPAPTEKMLERKASSG